MKIKISDFLAEKRAKIDPKINFRRRKMAKHKANLIHGNIYLQCMHVTTKRKIHKFLFMKIVHNVVLCWIPYLCVSLTLWISPYLFAATRGNIKRAKKYFRCIYLYLFSLVLAGTTHSSTFNAFAFVKFPFSGTPFAPLRFR